MLYRELYASLSEPAVLELAAEEEALGLNSHLVEAVNDQTKLARLLLQGEMTAPDSYIAARKAGPVDAPYAGDLEAVWAWIATEQNSYEASSNRTALVQLLELSQKTRRFWWASDNPVLQKAREQDRIPVYYANIESEALGFFFATGDEGGEVIDYYQGPIRSESDQPESGDKYVQAVTEKLLILAICAADIMHTSMGAWSKSQSVAYILTGEVPHVPRWRVRIDPVWGVDRKRTSILMFGSYNDQSLRDIHRIVRKRLGSYNKKALTPEDDEILFFVQRTPGVTWNERLQEWNSHHGNEHQYQTPQGLIKAFQRALKRSEQP